MKTGYRFLLASFVICVALIGGSWITAQGGAPVTKVAITPIRALGDNDATRKMIADVKKALFDKAADVKGLQLVEAAGVREAPKGVSMVLVCEINLQGGMAFISIKLIDPANGQELSSEMTTGSESNPGEVASKILEIIRKQAPSISAPPPQPTTMAITPPTTVAPPATVSPQPQPVAPQPPPPQPAPVTTQPAPPPVAPPPVTVQQPVAPQPAQPAAALSGQTIAVRTLGAGVWPVDKNREALARRSAFLVAERDAVERALGATMDVIAVPEQERKIIMASLQGKLKNVVSLIDKKDGDLYIAQIEADVMVPIEYISKYPAPPPESTGMPPALQPFPNGSVNWGEGYLTAVGIGKTTGMDAAAIEMAKRAARVDAYAVALEMIKGVNYDPNSAVVDVMGKEKAREYRIRGLVQGAEVVNTEQAQGSVKVTIRVPLWGLKGVTLVFSDYYVKSQPPAPEQPQPGDQGGVERPTSVYSGLVIDARGTGLKPALFPVVADESGAIVYQAGMVSNEYLSRHGVAAYSLTGSASSMGAMLGPNPLRIKAVSLTEDRSVKVAGLGDGVWGGLFRAGRFSSGPQFLAQAAAKVVLRQGTNAATVKAAQATGKKKAMVVIPNKSAQLVKTGAKTTNYLAEGRVVIIIDSMVGATEGRRLRQNSVTAQNR